MGSTDPVVAWALLAGLGMSVTWFSLHGWRQGRRLRRWAADNALAAGRDGDGVAAVRLRAFDRDSCHLRREFRGVREVVRTGRVMLVRCRETVDLFPWRSGTGPPKIRVAAVFPVRTGAETYTILDGDGQPARSISPGVRFADLALSRRIARRLPAPPPHPLSVTISGGTGIAYLLTPSGTVSRGDLDYLERLGRSLARRRNGAPLAGDHEVPGAPEPVSPPVAGTPGPADPRNPAPALHLGEGEPRETPAHGRIACRSSRPRT